VKDKVTRQVRLIDRDIDDQQLQEYVDNPQLAQDMLQKKIYGQASTTLKNAVSDIQDKFRDIQKLEASVLQCVQLFNELSALVFAQGEKIDSIEANVAECKDYI
jgi:syntaxin 1B/2/3